MGIHVRVFCVLVAMLSYGFCYCDDLASTTCFQACEELEQGYRPPITFIVVQKRHHTRLFPQNPRDGDRNGNIQPGTVVDTGIVGPRDFEFFLNSHAGIQGTNKSAHYHVLVDENGFGSDGLQLMTYWSSFLYCRCTRCETTPVQSSKKWRLDLLET